MYHLMSSDGVEKALEEIRKKSTEDMEDWEINLLPLHDKAIRGLAYDSSIYDKNWFESQGWQHPWCDKVMGWIADEYGPFETSLDLGAGDGYYSHVLAKRGTKATAVEVSENAMPVMGKLVNGIVHDLREPLDLGRKFDVVICFEVAEHLPMCSSDTLCDTIARHCDGLLLFTAAPLGQGGHGHCNCQPFDFWNDRLKSRGLGLSMEDTEKTRTAWKDILGKELPWLTNNILLYRRQK